MKKPDQRPHVSFRFPPWSASGTTTPQNASECFLLWHQCSRRPQELPCSAGFDLCASAVKQIYSADALTAPAETGNPKYYSSCRMPMTIVGSSNLPSPRRVNATMKQTVQYAPEATGAVWGVLVTPARKVPALKRLSLRVSSSSWWPFVLPFLLWRFSSAASVPLGPPVEWR